MEKRVKIFWEETYSDLERNINRFLETTHGKLHDIKFSMSQSTWYESRSDVRNGALLIYTPGDES